MSLRVGSVSLSPTHSVSKTPVTSITLVQNYGVSGDSHAGATIQHLYRQRINLNSSRRSVSTVRTSSIPGTKWENVTTSGTGIFGLGRGDRSRFVRDGVEEEERSGRRRRGR
ncbi:unnamed protein product [Tuber aestivum]|uniref:MOSC domain-containing protein n=1 Tax=Tuber aestivum TaxID=59557 RepID=A0A292Q7V6_9PEZI|nr:unnamed protein product [Tuber aestivum]